MFQIKIIIMLLSKTQKEKKQPFQVQTRKQASEELQLTDFIKNRDYSGAIALIEVFILVESVVNNM